MASKHQQPMKSVHFFKVILTRTLGEGKLRIPSKFVSEYGEGLPNTVFLKLPSGAEWKINVAKRGDQVWFEKGWKEFAKYHTLAHGHFLVFRYVGTSCFEILIFHKCGLEIDYPLNRKEGKEVAKPQGFQAPKINIPKECPPCRKRKDNSKPAFLQSCKKTRAHEDGKIGSLPNLHKETLHHTRRACKEHSHGVSTFKIRKQKRVRSLQQPMVTKGKKGRALVSSQWPYFHVVMQPSYIHSHGPLNIPAKFFRRYLDLEKKRGILTLKVLDGRVWPVTFLIRNIGTRVKFELCKGWKAFAKANNLNLGDVCAFELIHRTEIAFRVSIFRASDSPICHLSQESAKKGAASQGKIKKMETKTIFTMSRMPPCTLPRSFDNRFIKSGGRIVTMQVGEKSWRIKLNHYPSKPSSYFSAGWSAFVRENALEVRDVCLFNWLSTDVMEVSIFKHLEV